MKMNDVSRLLHLIKAIKNLHMPDYQCVENVILAKSRQTVTPVETGTLPWSLKYSNWTCCIIVSARRLTQPRVSLPIRGQLFVVNCESRDLWPPLDPSACLMNVVPDCIAVRSA